MYPVTLPNPFMEVGRKPIILGTLLPGDIVSIGGTSHLIVASTSAPKRKPTPARKPVKKARRK